MRVESYTALHYGKDYLRWAMLALRYHVRRAHVVYVPRPSHGHRTNLPCPETRDELRAEVADLPWVAWHDASFRHEGKHRDFALSLCEGDLALVVDADEVWAGDVLGRVLRHVYDEAKARQWLVNFSTPWRSFDWLCTDEMWPVRIHDLRQHAKTGSYVPKELGPVYHFGYAVTDRVMRYKTAVHGHKGEWREGWLEEKWDRWPPSRDVHPTCEDTWHPEPFSRYDLPRLMWDHPFHKLNAGGMIK